MLEHGKDDTRAAVASAGGQRGRANLVDQVAAGVNALLVFTSVFGVLGVGVCLHAADSLARLRRPDDILA